MQFDLILSITFICFAQYVNSWPQWLEKLTGDNEPEEETWTGRWFPDRATQEPINAMEGGGGIHTMGVQDFCDDGKTNLKADFKGDSSAYICLHPRNRIVPDGFVAPLLESEDIPPIYQAQHKCMNESISYSSNVPTFGSHRQIWPVYGEYKYLPTQRWLHTLEHGGIVALYHPCADLRFIKVLKHAVKTCLRKHVITPLETLDEKRPFVLVAWGVRLRMPWVSSNGVRDFIQTYALRGPEKVNRDGQFTEMLIDKAHIVSDLDDAQLCPRPLAHD